jgi:hypothetical protein
VLFLALAAARGCLHAVVALVVQSAAERGIFYPAALCATASGRVELVDRLRPAAGRARGVMLGLARVVQVRAGVAARGRVRLLTRSAQAAAALRRACADLAPSLRAAALAAAAREQRRAADDPEQESADSDSDAGPAASAGRARTVSTGSEIGPGVSAVTVALQMAAAAENSVFAPVQAVAKSVSTIAQVRRLRVLVFCCNED